MKIITLILFLLHIQSIARADCSTIELDKNQGSMANVTVRSQKDTSTCFAQVASQMMDAHLYKKEGVNANKSTDALIAALLTNGFVDEAGLKNFSCDAIKTINNFGSCNRYAIKIDENKDLSNFIETIANFHIEQKIFSTPVYMSTYKYYVHRKTLEERAKGLYCYLDKNSSMPLDNLKINDLVKVLDNFSRDNYMKDFAKLICKNKTVKPKRPPACISDRRIIHGGKEKSNSYKAKINSLLEAKGAGPIAVGYCGDLLTNGKNYRGYKSNFFGLTSTDVFDCGLHESLVIGRKMIGGKCYFKIRNSWGKNGSYHKDWSGLKEHSRDGNVWLDADALTENMGSMSYLK